MEFINLFVKSEYSMLESTCSISSLVSLAKEKGCTSLAITDEGNMHGIIKFYQACLKVGIHPIIGLKLNYRFNDNESTLLLYALNNFGYQNLLKIASRIKINNGYVELEYLQKVTMGILAIVPTRYSIVLDHLERQSHDALLHLRLLEDMYDYMYVGVSKDSNWELESYATVKKFAIDNHFKMVALHEVACLNNDQKEALQVLKAIKTGKYEETSTIDYSFLNNNYYLRLFEDNEEAVENTMKIAEACQVKLEFDKYQLPRYSENIEAAPYLMALCQKGLFKRLTLQQQENRRLVDYYQQRLEYELKVIHQMGFDDYFLIVWDFIKYAKKQGMYVGPGRGSAPASLVSYCLGITDIDPIYHQLLFERFLNPERLTMPDIDTDFPDDSRDEVIKYVGEKYGKDHVAHIVTFGCFASRSAIRDVAKVLKLSDTRLKEILKHLGRDYFLSLKEICEKNDKLRDLMDNYPDINKVLSIAIKIEGLPRNTSTHAAGIVMTKNDLVNYTPLDNGLDGIYQTQYDAPDLEKLGLLKMDFLGLRNLSIIKNCIDSIKKENKDFVFPKVYNDEKTFRLIADGDTMGVFQLESTGIRKVLRDLKVSSFEDVTSAIALYRPGPMDIIPSFIKRKFKEEKVTYPHPDLEPILKSTYGTIVYQDQIMLIAWKFAGYTLGQADVLRRAVSKKKKEVLEKERVNFVASSINQGYTKEVAEEIYDYIVKFANYGFNKAHSVAYAVIAYQTAYLKTNYPVHYFSTLMSSVIGADNMLSEYIRETTKKGIKVLSPDINESDKIFVTKGNQILFPLSGIMSLGGVKMNELLQERSSHKFDSFEDFITRVKNIISFSLIENIIYSGALDSFGYTKKAMIDNYERIINRSQYKFILNNELLETNYDNEEFPYGYLLEKEKDVLGLNLKYSFMFQYEHLYKDPKLVKINKVVEGAYVSIIGVIKKYKEIKTSSGEMMVFATVYDDSETIEATIFPKLYSKIGALGIGQVYQIDGKIDKRKNQLQIIVEKLTEI